MANEVEIVVTSKDRTKPGMQSATNNVKDYRSEVEKTAARVLAARDAEADAAGKVRVAELALEQVRNDEKATAVQLADAEEKLATAQRNLASAARDTATAVENYTRAQERAQVATVETTTQVREASRETNRFGNKLASIGKTALRSFAKVAVAGSTLNTVVAIVAGLGTVAAASAGALGVIPGVLMAGAAAAAAVKLGQDGITRAFERTTPVLDEMRSKVSDTFYHALEPAVENVNELLPKMTGELQGVAVAMSRATWRFTDMLRKARNVDTVNAILRSSSRIIQNVSKFLAPVGQALLDVGAVGAEVFADMTEGAEDVGDRFAAWVREMRDSGQLREWMQDGIDTLKEIGRIVGDVAATVGSAFDAMREGGAGFGVTLGPLIEKVREFVESAEGQEVFRTLGGILNDLSRIVMSLLEPALSLLPPIIGPLGRLIEQLANFCESHLGPALQDLADVIGPVVGWFLDLMAAADGLGMKILLAAAAFGMLLKVSNKIKNFAGTVTTALLGAGKGARRAGRRTGGDYVDGVAGGMKKSKWSKAADTVKSALALIPGWGWGLTLANEFTQGFLSGVTDGKFNGGALDLILAGWFGSEETGGKGILPWVENTAASVARSWHQRFRETFMEGQGSLTETVVQGTAQVSGAWHTAAASIGSSLIALNTSWVDSAAKMDGFTQKGLTSFGNMRNWVSTAMSGIQTSTSSGWSNVLNTTRNMAGGVAGTVSQKASQARSSFSAGVWGMSAANSSAWARVVAATQRQGDINRKKAQNAARQVRGAFSGLSLWSQGSAIMSSLRAGMSAALPGVLGFAAGIAAQIAAVKGPLEKDRRLLIPHGRAIMSSLRDGIMGGLPEVLNLASTIAPQVADRVGSTQLTARAKAAQEMLNALKGGRTLFEDFSFKGMSANGDQFNDLLSRDFYRTTGQDFGAPGTREAMMRYLQQQIAAGTQPQKNTLEIKSDGSRLANLLVELMQDEVRRRGGLAVVFR